MAGALHDVHMIHTRRAVACHNNAKDCLKRPRMPGPRNMNLEDAIRQLHHAQTSYRIEQEWEEAGECLHKSAELMWKLGDKHEAMITLSDCADLLERGNFFDSVEIYKTLISWACDLSRYSEAGRYQQRIAEMLEEGRNYEDALDAYSHAAHFYRADVKIQEAHECMIKYATLSADLEEYDKALEALLGVGKHCLHESNLTKFNAREYFFRAGLVLLAQGRVDDLKTKLSELCELDHGLVGSKEYAFLKAMMEVHSPNLVEGRLDKFADDLYDFDNVCPLSSWAIRMIRRFRVFVEEDAQSDVAKKEAKRKAASDAVAKMKADMRLFVLETLNTSDNSTAEEGEEGDEEETGERKEGEESQTGEGEGGIFEIAEVVEGSAEGEGGGKEEEEED